MLRGLCAVAVIFRHYSFSLAEIPGLAGLEWLWRPFGYVPVLLFFCLSGFLITQGFVRRRYDAASPSDLYCYYINRVLRVVPLYYLSILVCLYLYWPSAQARLDEVASLFWFMGAYKQSDVVFNHVYWSLPVEMLFFLLAPLVYLVCNACYRRLGLLGSLSLVILAYGGFSVELFGGIPQESSVVLGRAEWNRLAHLDALYNFQVFFLGAIAAIHLERREDRPRWSRWSPLLKLGLILSLLLLLERTGSVGDRLFEQGRVDVVTLYFLLPLLGLWFLGFARVYAGPRVRTVWRGGVAWRGGAGWKLWGTGPMHCICCICRCWRWLAAPAGLPGRSG
ncbi:acyltransferase family protein [Pseudomonas sp. CAN2814]|uniref:acyltransferase family protein n=1 Tax=Pseudomonas sp. CAN1 TaxID=3046726 RepID=UPI002647A854|nr:acyltransferase family protein [Pseudomonas sp. CAN1]MDN6856614.1 acyltransferase family protein [Pseudomonas sp. CAN1]